MSAPVTERGRTAVPGRTAAIPAQRGFPRGAGGDAAVIAPTAPLSPPPTGAGQAARRSAQQKAYARRDERVRRVAGVRPAAPAGRPQFVLLIMVLLATGLVATLWLSTAAAADSYRLQDATAEARVLSEQAEQLKQEVAVLASAPELARRAGELGMVPVRDPARLVVAADGTVGVVGQPRAAVAPPPPAPPAPPAGAQPPAPSGTDGAAPANPTPGATAPDGTAQLAAPDTEEAGTPAVDGGDTPAEGAGRSRSGQGESVRGESRQGESGQNAAGQGATGQGATGQGATGQGATGQGTTGQGTTGQGTTGQGTTGQGTGQDAGAGTASRAGGGGTDAG